MEARSLASLNLLAANPPSYPVNPTEQAQEPLVLYLARVPGTRDVILSPFKPQLKNVTAEDVASSLYYVHLELHSTDLSTPAPIHNDAAVGRSSEDSNSSMTIRRKPLPPHARPITPESMLREVYPPPNPEFDHPPVIPTRSPQRQSPSRDTGPRPASPAFLGVNDRVDDSRLVPEPLKLARKPAGRARAHSDTKYLTPGYGEQSSTHDTASTHHHHRNHHHHQPHHAGKASFDAPRSTRSPSPLKASSAPTAPFTLTLIRRDPSSGQQWNVGQISSQQLEALEDPLHEDQDCYFPSQPPSPTHAQLLAQPPIDVRIETSGYAKFRNRPSNRRAETGHDEVDSFGGMFARRIAMSYSKSWTSNLRDKLQDTKLRHQRAISAPSTHSLNSEQMSEGFAVRDPTQGMRPRGYVFRSPWDGRCEFRTGNGGRSLRCHHLLHDGKSAAYNPLVAEQTDSGQRGSSSVVSELRFNLPSSEVLSANYDKDDKPRRLGHFSKFFRSSAERGDDSYDDDDDAVSPFDVNLGRERAGGGNRGKRAKLGKLIIYNDGLKMLDLLVATNIGLWWLTWEKSF